jgi:hypothetical protein
MKSYDLNTKEGVIMKQRNFVAKHARSCGAGRHTVRTKYSRKQKHKGGL